MQEERASADSLSHYSFSFFTFFRLGKQFGKSVTPPVIRATPLPAEGPWLYKRVPRKGCRSVCVRTDSLDMGSFSREGAWSERETQCRIVAQRHLPISGP